MIKDYIYCALVISVMGTASVVFLATVNKFLG